MQNEAHIGVVGSNPGLDKNFFDGRGFLCLISRCSTIQHALRYSHSATNNVSSSSKYLASSNYYKIVLTWYLH